jgi:hypothetical protein
MSSQLNQRPDASQTPAKGKDPTAITLVCNDCSQTHQGATNPNPPKWYTPLKRPEWWLVGVGFITLGLIYWQAKKTAEAAEATQRATEAIKGQTTILEGSVAAAEKSAEAAKLNAQAVINSERPWLFIKTSDPGQSPRTAIVTFTFINRGRTPAEVTAHYVDRFFCIPDNLPPVPEYPLAGYELSHKLYLAPEDTFSLDSLNSRDFSDDAWKEASIPNAGGRYKWLVFQGHVVYRDLITREQHETRFCYFLSPNAWVGLIPCGPPGYNQHT